jgi:hypothetical protein
MPFTLQTAPPEILVEAFADLLSDRLVFTPDYGPALDELIYNLPNHDVKAIAFSIKAWCKVRPEIWQALENELSKRGAAKLVAVRKPPEDYKTLLKNRRRASFLQSSQQQSGLST